MTWYLPLPDFRCTVRNQATAYRLPASRRSLKRALILCFSRCILPGCFVRFLSLSHHHPRGRRHLPPALPRACFLSHPCPQALFNRICSFILFISRVSARRKCADALPRLSVIPQHSLQHVQIPLTVANITATITHAFFPLRFPFQPFAFLPGFSPVLLVRRNHSSVYFSEIICNLILLILFYINIL